MRGGGPHSDEVRVAGVKVVQTSADAMERYTAVWLGKVLPPH